MNRRVVILSDIHMGPGGRLTSFRDTKALVGLLDRLASSTESTELVLAGDTFDFLQIEGYAGFDVEQAAARLDVLMDHNKGVMDALARFCSRGGTEITVLAGNHDPELLLDGVRLSFEDRIGRRGSVLWADDKPLVPAREGYLPVWGREVATEDGPIWIVHGDRWDSHNAIDRDGVRQDVREGRPVKLPAGSHLVFEVLSQLKPSNVWVDELKPELTLVLPLLLYLDAQRTSEYIRKHFPIVTKMLRSMVNARRGNKRLLGSQPEGSSRRRNDVVDPLADAMADAISGFDDITRQRVLADLELVLNGKVYPSAKGNTLGAGGEVGRVLIETWIRLVRSADRFGHLDGPDSLPTHAKPLLPLDLIALIAGHSHGARRWPEHAPPYFNSGTWIPVRLLPRGDPHAFVDDLEQGRLAPADAPRTFVEVAVGSGSPRIRLMRCDTKGEPEEVPP